MQPIDQQLIKHVAALTGLVVPDEDLDLLAGAAQNQLTAAEMLRALELDDLEPIVSFDPRWR
jgi:hypothetical protein